MEETVTVNIEAANRHEAGIKARDKIAAFFGPRARYGEDWFISSIEAEPIVDNMDRITGWSATVEAKSKED